MAAEITTISDGRSPTFGKRLSGFAELTKPRIAILLVLTSAAGFYLASPAAFDLVLFSHSMAAIALLAFGVATLNQFWERELDVKMDRTMRRPIQSSRVTSSQAVVFGVLLCVSAEVYLFALVNTLTAVLGLIVIVGYLLLYTPLKTRTSASTAIGAVPGALPPLMGWTAAANEISLGAWALFSIQFLWQFPHFLAIAWLYREDYAKAGILMLPVVEPEGRITARQIVLFAMMLFPVSLAPFFLQISGIVFLGISVILSGWFLYESVSMALKRTDASAKRLLLASVIYLPLLYLAMVLDRL
ncbi:MAG: heme o synthase [Acidobacteria bacterium]|nr:heme o synthase [Acidobacteriota bacterium]